MAEAFVRYQSPTPNSRGHCTGIFGLVNGLARAGVLSVAEREFVRTTNAWYDAAYPLPDASVYDRAVNPLAASWFKAATTGWLLGPVPRYLEILRAHGVECVAVRSTDPGRVVYEDEYQVVVVPRL